MNKTFAAQLVEVGRAIEILADQPNIQELSFKPVLKKREVTLILKLKIGKPIHLTVCCSKTQYFTAEELLRAMIEALDLLKRVKEVAPERDFLVIKLGK